MINMRQKELEDKVRVLSIPVKKESEINQLLLIALLAYEKGFKDGESLKSLPAGLQQIRELFK